MIVSCSTTTTTCEFVEQLLVRLRPAEGAASTQQWAHAAALMQLGPQVAAELSALAAEEAEEAEVEAAAEALAEAEAPDVDDVDEEDASVASKSETTVSVADGRYVVAFPSVPPCSPATAARGHATPARW